MATAVSNSVVVERHSAIEPIAAEWDALAERIAAPPFAYPGWFAAWYEAFGRGRPLLLAARRDGRLAGVLPLERRAGALAGAANWHSPVFAPPAEDEHAARALARGLLAERAARHDLTLLDTGDRVLEELRALASPQLRVVARQPWVDASGDFETYEHTLPGKRRKELRRLRRRLEAEGEVAFEYARGGAARERLLGEGFAIEGSGWKDADGTAIASDPAAERFYRRVARWADERGWLVLAFLRLDGRAIAFDLHLEAGGAVYVLKGGYDRAFARHSPGSLLTHESLRRAFAADDVRSYEFLGDDAAYKLAWTSAVRERVRAQAFARTPAGLAQRVAWTHGRRAAAALRGLRR